MERSKRILIGPIAAAICLLALIFMISTEAPDDTTPPAGDPMAAQASDSGSTAEPAPDPAAASTSTEALVNVGSSSMNALAPQAALRAAMASQPPLSRPRAIVTDGLAVGDMLDPDRLHVITRPGLYGLPDSRHASGQYAILQGKLLRYDPQSMRLRAIIRSDVRPLD